MRTKGLTHVVAYIPVEAEMNGGTLARARFYPNDLARRSRYGSPGKTHLYDAVVRPWECIGRDITTNALCRNFAFTDAANAVASRAYDARHLIHAACARKGLSPVFPHANVGKQASYSRTRTRLIS